MKLPSAMALTNLVADLLGQRVTSKTKTALTFDPRKHVAATYLDDTGGLAAVAICDLPVGASFAAALSMVPPARVDECLQEDRLDDVLRDNLHEVFNVLSAIFPMSGSPRVVLHRLFRHEETPAEVKTLIAAPKDRLDLEMAVANYRHGAFALLAA